MNEVAKIVTSPKIVCVLVFPRSIFFCLLLFANPLIHSSQPPACLKKAYFQLKINRKTQSKQTLHNMNSLSDVIGNSPYCSPYHS